MSSGKSLHVCAVGVPSALQLEVNGGMLGAKEHEVNIAESTMPAASVMQRLASQEVVLQDAGQHCFTWSS